MNASSTIVLMAVSIGFPVVLNFDFAFTYLIGFTLFACTIVLMSVIVFFVYNSAVTEKISVIIKRMFFFAGYCACVLGAVFLTRCLV